MIKGPIALLTLLSLGLPASAQVDNYTPYHQLLARACKARHLEWISPGDLGDLIEDFEASLAPAARAGLEKANEEKVACRNVVMGATCGNVAALRAMTKVGLLAGFARKVCTSDLVCRGQSDCGRFPLRR